MKTMTMSREKTRWFCWIFIVINVCVTHQVLAQRPPTSFVRQPLRGSPITAGNVVSLDAEADSFASPASLYAWKRDGVELPQPSDPTVAYLRITNFASSDVGNYQCVARNIHGSLLSNVVKLQVATMDAFPNDGTLTTLTVDQGQAIVILLPALSSHPAPFITWKLNGTVLQDGETYFHISDKKHLVVLQTDYEKRVSNFTVRARNNYLGSYTEARYELVVQNVGSRTDNIPPSLVIGPEPQTTAIQDKDQSVNMECIFNARPLQNLAIKWYKGEGQGQTEILSSDPSYVISKNGRLLSLIAPTTSSSGIYKCVATLGSNPPAEATTNLTVYVPPTFSPDPPSAVTKDIGQTVELPCQTAGLPAPTVTWYKNAAVVTSTMEGYTILPNNSLQIQLTSSSEGGVYQCFAKNIGGEINTAIWLKVESSPPVITEKPADVSVIVNEVAHFSCAAMGAPNPTLSWARETSNGQTPVANGGRYQIANGKLTVQPALQEDGGKYVCIATNSQGATNASANLRVMLPTQISMPPQDTKAVRASTATLSCGYTHDPSVVVTVNWFKDNQPVRLIPNRVLVTSEGHLEIRTVGPTYNGVYKCVVTSEAGNDTASATLAVIEVPYAPLDVTATLNQLDMKAVDVSWRLDYNGGSEIKHFIIQKRILPEDGPIGPDEGWELAVDGVLPGPTTHTVLNLLPARNYQFRMSAVNGVGEGAYSLPSSNVTIPQQAPSAPPLILQRSAKSSTSIEITWSAPPEAQWNGPLTGYRIRYKLSAYSTLSYVDYPNVVALRHTITALDAFTEYDIAITAYNVKGDGVYSDYVTVRTEEDVPGAPVTISNASAVSSTSVYLEFSPPPRYAIPSNVLGFKFIAQRPNVAAQETVVTRPVDSSNVAGKQTGQITGLRKYTDYSVRIVCFTNKGDGPSSLIKDVKTKEDVPDQVADLSVTEVKHSSAVVQWSAPLSINGDLQGYTLVYMEKGADNSSRIERELFPNVTTFRLSTLKPETEYTVEVYARTRVGPGQSRRVEIQSGVTPVPPLAPTALAVTNGLARSVVLQFEAGFKGYTSITLWIVEGQVVGSNDWNHVYNESAPDASRLTVRNLRPFTKYRLRMKAQNVAGTSGPSLETQEFETLMDIPDVPPSNLTLRALNETAIIVRWMPLKTSEWNGIAQGYKIQYKPSTATSFTDVLVSDKNANSFNLINLQEWTEYDIRMKAVNALGQTPHGKVKTERTWESVPASGPRILQVIAINSTAIEVRWDPVVPIDQNGQIRGYKIMYAALGDNVQWKTMIVMGDGVRSATVSNLRKFVKYQIKMLAFTNIGDGVITPNTQTVETMEDTPGPPSSIYFPEVTGTMASIVWSPPREPNGIITGYKVSYKNKDGTNLVENDSLDSGRRMYQVAGLESDKTYVFSVTAKTRLGWGEPKELEVMTYLNRRLPDPPENVIVSESSISARSVIVNWVPGNQWYSPIRNYTIQHRRTATRTRRADVGNWVTIPEVIEYSSELTSYTVTGLIPNSMYQFRMSATNDIGSSPFSALSSPITTKQAAPSAAPVNLRVTPYTTTSVKVTWQPPPEDTWNGPLSSYRIQFKEENFTNFQEKYVTYPNTSSSLTDLTKGVNYEIRINAQNSQGHGPSSRSVVVFVGEAVPTARPRNVRLEGVNSTKIQLSWDPPPPESQNGNILGYRVFYWVTSYGRELAIQEVARGEERTYVMSGLHIFTQYSAVILPFNLAGDGPNSSVVSATTREGAPGPPGKLLFQDVTLTSLNVSWPKPALPNGNITAYYVVYYQLQEVDGETKNVEVEVTGNKTFYLAADLKEYVQYGFKVSARTSVDRGPYTSGNITTGPQPGSPQAPVNPRFIPGDNSVTIVWNEGDTGDSPIKGYVVQAKPEGSETWSTVTRKSNSEPKAVISYLNLIPNTAYRFRVIAFNSQGISLPSVAKEMVRTPDYTTEGVFYHQWWFLVIVALGGLILIISIVAILCFVGRKKSKEAIRFKAKSTEEMTNQVDEGGFNTFELRRSQRAQSTRAASSHHNGTIPVRHPPRPSPSSVTYSDEEKPPKYPDSSSMDEDEKPSDLDSPTESEVSETEPESEEESENRMTSFTNHYVNAPVRQSWKKQKPSNAYSYTDSEQESQYAVSLNGHVIMNNTAGSRAPLPGFSSFV